MKIKAILLALFVAGLATSFAIAAPPPGKGKNKGQTTGSTSGTTATGTTSTTTTGGDEKKVTICHKTGSKKKPWVKIKVSKNALPAHMAHGDKAPGADGDCPKAGSTGGTTTGTTTGTTGTTTGATAQAPAGDTKGKGNNGKGKGKGKGK